MARQVPVPASPHVMRRRQRGAARSGKYRYPPILAGPATGSGDSIRDRPVGGQIPTLRRDPGSFPVRVDCQDTSPDRGNPGPDEFLDMATGKVFTIFLLQTAMLTI